jgi:hypothetical protein
MAPKHEVKRTDAKVATFLERLAEGFSVGGAAQAAGFDRVTAYRWRAADPEFAAAWDAARETGSDALEDEARRRACEGVQKLVLHQGKPVLVSWQGYDGEGRDFDGARDAVTGTIVWAAEGSSNPGTFWRVTTANPVVFGTSNISFAALDIFAALLPQTLTALAMPRVNAGGTGYELRSPGQVLSDISGLKTSNNLSDVTSAVAARGNLGLGTIATQDASAVSISGGSGSFTGTLTAPAPASGPDVATKSYVDGVAVGLGKRGRVRLATTANITRSGAQTIDGISAVSGDLVLVKDQSSQAENGVFTVASGAWTRDGNYDTWVEIEGCLISVEEGSVGADTLWMCTANSGGTLETTAITFSKVAPGSGGTVTNLTASNGVKTTSGLAITSTGNVELDVADQATAEAGASNTKAMTPLRAFQAIPAYLLSLLTASGDLLIRSGASLARLAKATDGNVLTLVSGLSAWAAPPTPLFSASYDSGDQTITVAGALALTHGLGAMPKTMCWLHCTTGEHGYSVGDYLLYPAYIIPAANYFGVAVVASATQINVYYGDHAPTTFEGINKTTRAGIEFTNASWRFVVRAYA